MGLNRDRVGHRYPAFRYEVSREKIREYALATGHDDPVYRADARDVPLEQVVAPPTFAALFTVGRADALATDPELGLHPRLVHGAQRFTFHRPVKGGDVLECTPWVVDIVERGGMELLTYQVDCVDARDGTPVVEALATLVLFPEDR